MFQQAGMISSLCKGCRDVKHFRKKDHLWSKEATKKGLDLASGFEQISEPVCVQSWQPELRAQSWLCASKFAFSEGCKSRCESSHMFEGSHAFPCSRWMSFPLWSPWIPWCLHIAHYSPWNTSSYCKGRWWLSLAHHDPGPGLVMSLPQSPTSRKGVFCQFNSLKGYEGISGKWREEWEWLFVDGKSFAGSWCVLLLSLLSHPG